MTEKATGAAAAPKGEAAAEKKDQQQQGNQGAQDFSGAFSEFAKAKTGESSTDTTSASSAAVAADPNAGKVDEQGKVVDASAGKKAEGEAAAGAKKEDDIWKDAPAALREAYEKERQRAEQEAQGRKSAEGRYRAANSKAAELERQVRTSTSSGSAAAPVLERPAADKAAAAGSAADKAGEKKPASESTQDKAVDPKGPQMPPEWKQLQETLPDVAKAVEARFGAVFERVEKTLAAVKPVQEREAERFVSEQGTLLNDAYPGWNDEVKTPKFQDWIKQQPQSVQALALSDYAADNAALLEYYGYTPAKKQPEPQSRTEGTPAGGGKSAAEIEAERTQRLARNESVRSTGSPVIIADAPDNYEAAFSYYARKRQEAQARARA